MAFSTAFVSSLLAVLSTLLISLSAALVEEIETIVLVGVFTVFVVGVTAVLVLTGVFTVFLIGVTLVAVTLVMVLTGAYTGGITIPSLVLVGRASVEVLTGATLVGGARVDASNKFLI